MSGPNTADAGTVCRPDGAALPYRLLAGGPRRMVLAHSLFTDGLAAQPVVQPLLASGWSVLTFDQRGHGQASPLRSPSEFSVATVAADILAVLDAAGWDRAHFAGGSMGAASVLAAAAAAPQRVTGLALIAPAFTRTPNSAMSWFDQLADELSDRGSPAAEQLWSLRMPGSDNPIARLGRADPVSLGYLLRSVCRWTLGDEFDRLVGLDMPAVVLAWPGDPVHPWAAAEETAALFGTEVHRLAPGRQLTPLAMFEHLAGLLA